MARLTITKDPGYASTANVDGRALTGDVSLSGDTITVGGETFKIGSMRITMETAVEQPFTPQAPADHPAMVASRGGESSGTGTAGGGTASAASTAGGAGGGAAGLGGATPAADGGNAPSTRSR